MTFRALGGTTPTYRLAPDRPPEIAADLARLCAGPGQSVPATGIPMSAEAGISASPPRDSTDGEIAHFRLDISALGTDSALEGIAAARAGGTAPPARAANGLGPKSDADSTAPAIVSPSRRLALFGAAAALLAPPLARPAASRVAEADAELARLADEIDRAVDGAAYALEPVDDEHDQNRRLRHAEDLMLRMVDVPAVGLAGVRAKAKGYLDSLSYDVLESAALAQSLAEDAERVCGGVLA